MMNKLLPALLLMLATVAGAQPPKRPLIPLDAPPLTDYLPVSGAEAFQMDGHEFASVASVAFTAAGHLLVLHRGEQPFLEFDANGKLLRSFGDPSLFGRSHGLTIDAAGNLWVTDVGTQVVMKMNPDGEVLMTLGNKGEAGEWNEASGSHLFNQPNEVALDAEGNIYVAQGHGPAEPRILKFTPEGRFIKQWGSRGTGPGQFAVAHSIQIDAAGNVYVADRENFRVQIFDTEGNYLREWKFNAMACAIHLHDDGYMYMTTGFDGQFARLSMDGQVLGAIGSPGADNGQFGEAHFLTLDENDNVFVADVVNRRVQKYLKQSD
ncbi:MAG: peptidyl-alpha-hydroxyglycine alpha-amidating lyase family protein [Pseudomonadales bacterium]|nr:peptidyl-alpha-hydroxyglycine alpha-amidating lyase family protein [Pseudomonadales bacterium]